jgi:UDP-N-acetylglucosamine--dolichyl-phosphate N-acetylglucosaminephosphotransferase
LPRATQAQLVRTDLPIFLYNTDAADHRYPARAFIGDTFCYFSGMAFAVVGILGHFSKTLLLFFLPQIFNFLYSLPQLTGIIPCPRHRLPRFNEKTGLLEPSFAVILTRPRGLLKAVLEVLGTLRLVRLVRGNEGEITGCSNFTILNLILVTRGPMKEDRLTIWMLGVQVAGSMVAFGIRYGVSGLFYDSSRR